MVILLIMLLPVYWQCGVWEFLPAMQKVIMQTRITLHSQETDRFFWTSQDAHAWTEIYMDGMGWIPVDFTPGFYYNTYALLRMAELPQKTAGAETADCVSLYRHFTWKRYAAALKSDRRTHHGKKSRVLPSII